jgi:membrane associated rhomboid family serine protease
MDVETRMTTSSRNVFGASMTGTPVTTALVVINVLFFLLLTVTGGSQDSVNLYRWGAKYGPAIADVEWWRLIVPIFMHIGFFHLLTNSIGLLIFGSMVERLLGGRIYLSIYLVTGVLGNVASFAISPTLGAGASGAVFGVIGAFGVYLLLNRRVMGEVARQAMTSIAFIIVLNLVIGFATSGIDNAAHLGGLIAGMAMAYLVAPRQQMILTQEWPGISPVRLGVDLQRRPGYMLVLAILIATLVTVATTMVRSNDYQYSNDFERCGYYFADFTDPVGNFPFGCRALRG